MNKNLYFYYAKYKAYVLPVVLVALGFFIVSRVIVPQLSSIGEKRQEIRTKEDAIAALETSLDALSKQNSDQLTDYLGLAGTALPTSKNIAMVFDTLTSAAAASGTDLNDFSLKVGGLYGRAEKVSTAKDGTPTLDVELRVSGADSRDTVKFIKEIQTRLPLSEVKGINTSGGFANVEISFFYKPLNTLIISKQESVRALNQSDLSLLKQLETWANN